MAKDKPVTTKASKNKRGLKNSMIKVEYESQHFAQSISYCPVTNKEEEVGTQRAQDSNSLMNIKK